MNTIKISLDYVLLLVITIIAFFHFPVLYNYVMGNEKEYLLSNIIAFIVALILVISIVAISSLVLCAVLQYILPIKIMYAILSFSIIITIIIIEYLYYSDHTFSRQDITTDFLVFLLSFYIDEKMIKWYIKQ